MLNPNLVFPQTSSHFLSFEEERTIYNCKGSYHTKEEKINEAEINLFNNGFLTSFQYASRTYYFDPDTTEIYTFVISFPTIKAIKNLSQENGKGIKLKDSDEEKRRGYLTKVIAHWLCGEERITSIAIKSKIIFLHQNNVKRIVSIPENLVSEFKANCNQAGITVEDITLTYATLHCNYCGHNFTSEQSNNTTICPSCNTETC